MFRWGSLPRIMADGGGRGICTFIVLQALSQAETSWSRAEADTIWAAATAKVLLGGASHVDHLRDIESSSARATPVANSDRGRRATPATRRASSTSGDR
jgi:type IV secretory pathway TraG/TraD family ATPase VirD4